MARNRRTHGAIGTADVAGTAGSARSPWRVAAYLRVSTDEQAQSGLGLGDQRGRCVGMAAAKGWPVPALYADEGASGTRDAARRPALARLLEDARAGRVDAVIVAELARLGRRTRLVLDLVEELARCGVSLVSCRESLDTTMPQGQFVLTMFAALAQFERDVIRERTQAGLAAARARGRQGGRPRAAAVADAKRLALARRLYEDKRNTVAEICRTLGISRATVYRHMPSRAPSPPSA